MINKKSIFSNKRKHHKAYNKLNIDKSISNLRIHLIKGLCQ